MSSADAPTVDVVAAGLRRVKDQIRAACAAAGRSPDEITLVGVSKTFPADAVNAAVEAGLEDLGENRVQELRDKVEGVRHQPRWHLIGHLQKNKVKDAVRLFDVIHTVDSEALAGKLSSTCETMEKRMRVLLQVNVGGESQKSGVEPGDALPLAEAVASMKNLDLCGLMTIPPIASPAETHRYFRTLRELRDAIADRLVSPLFRELSMGMSEDFTIAIAEGATMVRIGRAIFGERGSM